MASRLDAKRKGGRLWSLVALLFALLAPMWLGPTFAPLTRALGATAHTCACGMKAGTCGCPECAELERERRDLRETDAHPVMKGSCTDDEGHPAPAPLPPCVLQAAWVTALARVATPAPAPRLRALDSAEPRPPPLPPPRVRVV